MLRQSLLPFAAAIAICLSPTADAQRRNAPVIQGTTSGELALTVEELRVSNAELRARMTGIESDKADLTGKVETLEFLLSQSRDQINNMQSDDAELDRLITQLEKRLSDQDKKISTLERDLSSMNASSILDETSADADLSSVSETAPAATDPGSVETTTTSGPTRIVRRTVATTQTPSTRTATDQAVVETTANDLPQGSLGTLPASALPGDAGPLFAEAKSRLLQFDYAGAETAFRSFLEQFSDDPQAGEAQYWLAEVLYQQEAYAESGAAYTTMIRAYPDDPRAPEALAKLARSMRLVGDTEQACGALSLLPEQYPNASGVTKNLAAGERVRSGCDS